jgi:hypothetical protein
MAWGALSSAVRAGCCVAAAVLAAASCSGRGTNGLERGVARTSAPANMPPANMGDTPMPPGVTTTSTGSAVPTGPHLVLPVVIDIPYVVAGQGGATAQVTVENDGDAPVAGLSFQIAGDPSISLGAAPTTIEAGARAAVTLAWTGSPAETIAQATLSVIGPGGETVIPVFAVAGDPGLGTAPWEEVEGAGNVVAGSGITVAMPSAPFPDGLSKFTDPSVRVFLPEGYRDRGAQDLVLHFHGWNTTVASTLATHLYQQHVYASGSNTVLVVPQGPVDAPSGDFGKLMGRGGATRLLTEVLVLLYREGKITHPVRGDLVVTSHSGGYQAVAASLDLNNQPPKITQIDLFDSIYGYEASFVLFVLTGGTLRSNYSETGGTVDQNQTVAGYLVKNGIKPATEATQRAFRDDAPVVAFAPVSHDGTTRVEGAFGEALRWKLKRSRHGPRVELREVSASAGSATARWLSPPDEDLTSFVVETSDDGVVWSAAAQVAASAAEATFPLAAGARVRVRPVLRDVDPAATLASDAYRVDPRGKVLVVDGFDRILDGSFGGLRHEFAAMIGEAVGPAASISHRAITEDGFDLSAFPSVLWLAGDQSAGDHALTPAEQTALLDYVNAGGHLVVSGSEVGFDLGASASGASFLDDCFGALFVADDAGSREVAGHGALATIPSLAIGGPGAPYPAASPDALGITAGGAVVLEYGSGEAAAVGRSGRAALVAFPLELVPAGPPRDALVRALLAFVSDDGGTPPMPPGPGGADGPMPPGPAGAP